MSRVQNKPGLSLGIAAWRVKCQPYNKSTKFNFIIQRSWNGLAVRVRKWRRLYSSCQNIVKMLKNKVAVQNSDSSPVLWLSKHFSAAKGWSFGAIKWQITAWNQINKHTTLWFRFEIHFHSSQSQSWGLPPGLKSARPSEHRGECGRWPKYTLVTLDTPSLSPHSPPIDIHPLFHHWNALNSSKQGCNWQLLLLQSVFLSKNSKK